MLETRSENSSRCDRCKLSIYLRRCFVLLLGVDYLWKDISLMLNVSWCTVYSCELHLENVTGFNNISDDGLDQPIQHFSILNKYMELWLGNLLNWDIYEVQVCMFRKKELPRHQCKWTILILASGGLLYYKKKIQCTRS